MFTQGLEELLTHVIILLVHMMELFGAVIIVYSGTSVFTYFLRTNKDGREVRLTFARFLIFGLEFKLAGEILRTVVVRTFEEILILGSIILLRAMLNLIVHWEIKQEKRDRN